VPIVGSRQVCGRSGTLPGMSHAASGLDQPAGRAAAPTAGAGTTGHPVARSGSGRPGHPGSGRAGSGRLAERRLVTSDPGATRALAGRLAAAARPGDVIALDGPLGAGKTEFARGFAAGLGVAGRVSSPSFVLMAEHEGRLHLFHLDGYRLGGPDDAWSSGLLDERRAEGVTVVEWATRFGPALPAGRLAISIDGAGDEPRTICLRGTDRRHRRLLAAALGPAAAREGRP
jgi:tRNA threonylcarbamoyladenosine biosynthesis protein TsaE